MHVRNFLWNLHRKQEWTLNPDKSLQRLSGWQVCLSWMCPVACTCVCSFLCLTRNHLNSTETAAFKLWPRCGLSIEVLNFKSFFLRWREHGCWKKKEQRWCGRHQWGNIYPIFPDICHKVSVLYCELDGFHKESWMNPTGQTFLLKPFLTTISAVWLFSVYK